ncbi:FHA domain-containing protein [Aquipuribacter nitratireducens]|uniref:FHA domain-containing protein n=1 Tax=Aquipuribacter nitratireducens TaxID=650104 RepID=A0ABW0GNL4_9MICO
MTGTCPNGHTSTADDYCDTCGAPMGASAVPGPGPSAPAAPAAPRPCPHCGLDNVPAALFCEGCGYDFTTGAAPRAAASPAPGEPLAPAVPLEWVLERWVDPEWHASQDSPAPCPSPGLPVVVPLVARSLLIGRPSASRNIGPDIDCTPDTAVSRRHAQLTTDGTRWWIEDLRSSNGTFTGPASGPLPRSPLPPGQRTEVSEGDRIYVGAWTRLVLRAATDAEKAQHG